MLWRGGGAGGASMLCMKRLHMKAPRVKAKKKKPMRENRESRICIRLRRISYCFFVFMICVARRCTYIFSGALTPMRVNPLCMTILTVCTSQSRAELSARSPLTTRREPSSFPR